MKTLHLLRHAKSEAGSGDDHERQLAERGVTACGLVGRYLREKEVRPGLVLCSTAARARATIGTIAAAAGWNPENPPIEFDTDLYMASAGGLLAVARRTSDACDSLMLVGHNPGMEDAARMSVGGGDPEALDAFAGKYATGALATIVFDVARWREAGRGLGRLSGFVKPRMLA